MVSLGLCAAQLAHQWTQSSRIKLQMFLLCLRQKPKIFEGHRKKLGVLL